jgi:NosR/NirI family nitrous oxide reductase transcriptional regulator
VTQSKGFSNRPLVLLVGINLAGRVTGVQLVHHTEPIGILGLNDEEFFRFTEHFAGHDIKEGVDIVKQLTSSPLGPGSFSQRATPGPTALVKVDAVARATTSSVLMSDAIVRGGRIVARSRGILSNSKPRARLDIDRYAAADWRALEAAGAIAHLHVTYADLHAKLSERAIGSIAAADPAAAPADAFLDLYVALLTPAGIGINILGKTWYDQYTAGRGIDDQIILIAANSGYSVLGQDWENATAIGAIELVQGEKTIRLSGKQIKTVPFLHAYSAPELSERALVFFQGDRDLDPAQPWQVRLLVTGGAGKGEGNFASFTLPYKVPDIYLLKPAVEPVSPAVAATDRTMPWQAIWRAHAIKIAVLALGLSALTVILFLQDYISRRRRLHLWIRIGFLSWTLIWLGWYAGAQLTVVNLITWIHTVVTDFRWDYVLADPLITILALFTLAGLFLWGRAVFCGWLCPFGALQELVGRAAQRLRIPQIRIPVVLHERLVAVKYLLFLGLIAVSFFSWDLAMAGTEVEPFKAAIILRFMTEWPMVAYAVALIVASVFVERFYCRFACPLGGGLAIFGRVRMFDWLKRRPECGSRCHLCEAVCPVGAIKRSGAIDMNECFYCLDCQVTYYDDHTCPPLVWRRKRLAQPAVPTASAVGPALNARRQ